MEDSMLLMSNPTPADLFTQNKNLRDSGEAYVQRHTCLHVKIIALAIARDDNLALSSDYSRPTIL